MVLLAYLTCCAALLPVCFFSLVQFCFSFCSLCEPAPAYVLTGRVLDGSFVCSPWFHHTNAFFVWPCCGHVRWSMNRFKIKLLSPLRLLNWAKAMFKPHNQGYWSYEAYFKYFCPHLNLFQPMLSSWHLVLMLVMTPQIKCHTPILNGGECPVAQKPNLTLLEVDAQIVSSEDD